MTYEEKMKLKHEFEKKYAIEEYGIVAAKLYLGDKYRMELTEEELKFMDELNMICESDPELFDILKNEYEQYGLDEIDKAIKEKYKNKENEKNQDEQER